VLEKMWERRLLTSNKLKEVVGDSGVAKRGRCKYNKINKISKKKRNSRAIRNVWLAEEKER